MDLNELIKQAYEIKNGLKKHIFGPSEYRPIKGSQYDITDVTAYKKWKNTVFRFLATTYHDDISNQLFKKAIEEFENKKSHFAPEVFQEAIGILESLQIIPEVIEDKDGTELHPSISITNNNSQSQNQSISLVVDILKDELTGRQLKELKDILDSKITYETKRKSVFDKIKSFGSDVAANILANIITNPKMYSFLFS